RGQDVVPGQHGRIGVMMQPVRRPDNAIDELISVVQSGVPSKRRSDSDQVTIQILTKGGEAHVELPVVAQPAELVREPHITVESREQGSDVRQGPTSRSLTHMRS